MVRIGSGVVRGRILKAPRDERPTLGRVKQTLFDILAWQLKDTRFLDLFAGSGAIGIEALSRGGKWATFVEITPRTAALISDNLASCGFSGQAEVICAEASRGLMRLASRGERFEIVFLDPPYEDLAALARAIKTLAEPAALLAPEGLIIIQRSRRAVLGALPETLELYDTRELGDSALDFLRRKQA